MSCTITLSNGRVLDGLEMSGTCFVSKAQITPEVFTGGLDRVRIRMPDDGAEGTELDELHYAMELGGVFKADGQWYFWLREPDAEELARLKNQADIEYIAMMTGVDL